MRIFHAIQTRFHPINYIQTTYYHTLILGKMAPARKELIYVDPQKLSGHMKPELMYSLQIKTGLKGCAGQREIC